MRLHPFSVDLNKLEPKAVHKEVIKSLGIGYHITGIAMLTQNSYVPSAHADHMPFCLERSKLLASAAFSTPLLRP